VVSDNDGTKPKYKANEDHIGGYGFAKCAADPVAAVRNGTGHICACYSGNGFGHPAWDGPPEYQRVGNVYRCGNVRRPRFFSVILYGCESEIFRSITDTDGNKLNTVKISREDNSCISGSCWFYNPLGINVDHDYLEEYKDSGISVKVFDQTGENIFPIPSAYIKAFLDKVS